MTRMDATKSLSLKMFLMVAQRKEIVIRTKGRTWTVGVPISSLHSYE